MAKPPPLKFLLAHPAHLIAGGFGSGYSPLMPGTTGTLFAWATYPALVWLLPLSLRVVFLLAAFCLGIWACQRTGRALGVPDHGSIVWDEIVPFWALLCVTSGGLLWQLAAFVLFRFFDIVKPFPASYFDNKVKNGFGVMMDDVCAAIYAAIAIGIANFLLA